MGCNPSKESQVATGNTLSTCNVEKKQSNDLEIKQSNVSKEGKIEEIADPIPDTGKVMDNVGENAEVKDVNANAANEEVEEEGKFTAVVSPDRYFSSRKDEEVVEGVVMPVEFLAETAEGPKIEEMETMVAVDTMVAVEKENNVSVEEEQEKAEEEKGEPSSINDSVDPKETIMVEELKESEVITTPEKQNEEEGAE